MNDWTNIAEALPPMYKTVELMDDNGNIKQGTLTEFSTTIFGPELYLWVENSKGKALVPFRKADIKSWRPLAMAKGA